MKKSALTLMMALGGPKSRNPDGVSSSSTSAPDQGGTAMAPGMGGDDEMAEGEMGSDHDTVGDEQEQGEDMLQLPKGFKPPQGSEGGGNFSTTIMGSIIDTAGGPMLKVVKIGDVPIHGPAEDDKSQDAGMEEGSEVPSDESPDQSSSPSLSSEGAAMMKRKKDEMAAKKVFQPSRAS